MKKTFFTTFSIWLLSIVGIFAQSVLIQPNNVSSKQSSGSDNLTLQGNNVPNIIGLRHNGTLTSLTPTNAGNFMLALEGKGYNGTSFTSTRARIIFLATENYTSTANGSDIRFGTTTNGTTTLTDKMIVANDGKIGIGTLAPARLLHVFDGSSGVTPNSFSTAFFENSSSSYIQMGSPDGTATGVLFGRPANNASGAIIYNSDDGLSLRTGGNNTRVTITSAGSVGIGTSAPTAKLDIEGDIVVKKSINSTTGTINALDRNGGSSLFMNGVGTVTVNGIDGGVDGMLLYVICGSSTTLVLANENASASAINRIATHTGANVTISGRGGATLIYDSTFSRWRIIGVAF